MKLLLVYMPVRYLAGRSVNVAASALLFDASDLKSSNQSALVDPTLLTQDTGEVNLDYFCMLEVLYDPVHFFGYSLNPGCKHECMKIFSVVRDNQLITINSLIFRGKYNNLSAYLALMEPPPAPKPTWPFPSEPGPIRQNNQFLGVVHISRAALLDSALAMLAPGLS
ncbi:hypothetical protein DSO57_1036414 [Entomophthora muscae]|uniref:Uncharacterized protein n=1 Tax=Entomophthora muscae TaxID=34485 RepID=A0ACC2SC08_9FUNG|nr:hypothetical protein DSO57_1036414 [Entomophthora muscae]